MSGCGKLIDVTVPTRYSAKILKMRCGSTSITGGMNLCDECAETVPNPPAYTYEDAGEEDFYPTREEW